MSKTLIISGKDLKMRTHATFNGAEYDTIARGLDEDTINDICRNHGLMNDKPTTAPAFIIEGNALYLFTSTNDKKLLCSNLESCYVSRYDFAEAVKYPVDRR